MPQTNLRSALTLAVVLLALSAAPAHAGWGTSGIAVTRAARAQTRAVAVTDGAGGMIVGWLDPRTGYNTDVYAQRVLPVGSIGTNWTPDGVGLTHVTCTKYDLTMTADGNGGAIAAWADLRCPGNGIARLYAQRVRPTGVVDPAWPADAKLLCTATALQEKPAIATDGAGGAFVVWNDRRSGFMALYATRVQGNGAFAPGWADSGRQLAPFTRDTCAATIASDGAGGALVAWVVVGPASDTVHVQRLTATGAVAAGWPANGAIACAAAGRREQLALAATAEGGAWLAWTDRRGADADVYATRITGAGVRAGGWSVNGDALASGAGAQTTCRVAALPGDVAVFGWADAGDIRAAARTANGAIAAGWPAGGTDVCTAAGEQSAPLLTADATGGVLVAWTDARDFATSARDLYALRLATDGSRAPGWPANGHPFCTHSADQSAAAIVPDGTGGALAAWTDTRNAVANDLDLYSNRLGPDGPLPTRLRQLAAVHHDGQTFLTATTPASTGYRYRIYASESPITSAADLANATYVGSPMDSSWYMKRLSDFMGTKYTYCVDSLATPLDSTQMLFVVTPTASHARWYAATAQAAEDAEDLTITPGENALVAPVQELVARPRPVWQRRITVHDQPTDMYTLWTSANDTPLYPAMSNRTSLPFDCAIRHGYASYDSTSLLVRPATRNLYCLNVIWYTPGYWLMAFDDLLPMVQGSFYYGYHEGFDLEAAHQPPPTGGVVRDYTRQRIVFMLEWARRTLPVDTTRVYAFGYSLAGAAAATLSFAAPQYIAGTQSVSGHYDYSFRDEPVANAGFNTGQYYEGLMNELWGPLSLNLPTNTGLPIYDLTDNAFLAGHMEPASVPPLMSFDGKRDVPMGWAEKVRFYQAMQYHRQGGAFFWDMHEHNTDTSSMWWLPMIGPAYLWRWSTNMSYPALSNCSADDDPGDGHEQSGDSLGTINGHVEWDSLLVDKPDGWAVTLRPRDLVTSFGPRPAPDSFTVDVTPRRVQKFVTPPGTVLPWRVLRVVDDAIIQSGSVVADSLGRVTVEGVRVHRGGSLLTIGNDAVLGVPPPGPPARARLTLTLPRQPLRGAGDVLVAWPAAADACVELFDVHGRRVRTLRRGPVAAGITRDGLGGRGLRAGMYWVVVSDGRERVSHKLVVLE
ncbi:MAG: hypothetical protein U0704_08595 [Candidatus Eisenbacteria bacterium]